MRRPLVSGQSTIQWIGWNRTHLKVLIFAVSIFAYSFSSGPFAENSIPRAFLFETMTVIKILLDSIPDTWFELYQLWSYCASVIKGFFSILPHFQIGPEKYVIKKWQDFFLLLLVLYKCRMLFPGPVLKWSHGLGFQIFCLFHPTDSLSTFYGLLRETGKADDQLIHFW